MRISHIQEKSRLFHRKVIQYSSENSFWLWNCDNFIIPKEFSLFKKLDKYLSNSRYISRLFENGCFDSNIDSSTLHFLCKESENLTYQQLCIIKIANEKNEKKYSLRKTSLRGSLPHDLSTIREIRHNLTSESFSTLLETIALGGKGYIMYDCVWTPQIESDVIKLLAPDTIEPLPAGEMIYEYMNLESIPEEDVRPVVKALS